MTLRQLLLADIYSRMTDEDKQTYALLRSHDELKAALSQQREDLMRIERQVGWWPEFANNVTSNVTTNILGWLCAKLLQKL